MNDLMPALAWILILASAVYSTANFYKTDKIAHTIEEAAAKVCKK